MARRDYAGGAAATTLAADITNTATTITIASGTGWPTGANGEFLIAIDRGKTGEEKCLVLSRSGTTLTLASAAKRGVDGTTAASHTSGVTVEHVMGALDVDEPNSFINSPGLVGNITASAPSDTALAGSVGKYADAGHRHSREAPADTSTFLTTGTHDVTARHTFGAALGTPSAPPAIGVAAAGTGTSPARSDHVHATPLTTKGDLLAFSTVLARLAVGTDGQVLTADAASTPGVKWAPAASTVPQFDLCAFGAAYSNVNWATFTNTSNIRWRGGAAVTDTTAQNNERVFLLPFVLTAGTWKLTFEFEKNPAYGIATVAVSPDATTFTDLTTFDFYASGIAQSRTEVTGLTIAAGMQYVRFKMATKNASASAYGAALSGFTGLRTGA